MINKIHKDIEESLGYVPINPINLFNRNRGMYYRIQNGILEWTGHNYPELFPYIGYEVKQIKYHPKKNLARVDITFEYSTLSDLNNSRVDQSQSVGVNALLHLDYVLTNKITGKNNPCYVNPVNPDELLFSFYEQYDHQLRLGVLMEVTYDIYMKNYYESICCNYQ